MNLQLTLSSIHLLILISVFSIIKCDLELLSLKNIDLLNYSHQNETEDKFDLNQLKSSPSEPSHPSDKKTEENNWSEWTPWSPCSRSCDGGISVSLRKCNSKSGCDGPTERYQICNMQLCPHQIDFRAVQCSSYNDKPYRGRYYQWLPFNDPLDPCSLTCKAKVFNFIAKLGPKVEDGTRCRDGSLDMCLNGKCMSVGCDLRLNSDLRIDDCGVCGGDSSSCKQPQFVWIETNFSPCSVSCGKGYQLSRPICIDKNTNDQVDEILCDLSTRPRQQVIECNTQLCPAKWIIGSWNLCNKKCGDGKQTRDVYCAQDVYNGTRYKVQDSNCSKHKPINEKSCNEHECPQWYEGTWSECSSSTTCSSGYQTRNVQCRDAQGKPSNDCDEGLKPNEKQKCVGIGPCKSQDDEDNQEDAPRLPFALPWVQRLTSPATTVSSEPNFIVGDWSPCSASCDKGIRKRTVECKIFLEFSKTIAKLPDSQCPGIKPPETESCFIKSCLIHVNVNDDSHEYGKKNGEKGNDDDDLDYDGDIIKDEKKVDDEGNDLIISQNGIENPKKKLVPLSKVVTYSWKNLGFTQCTASCLGGTQESNVQCVRDHDNAIVSIYSCDINKKPDSITRTCNDIPCPPRWNVSEFGPCSKECGSGEQTRTVQCIHEVTRGIANVITIPDHRCPQPPPRTKQFCNLFDCPAKWKPEPWTKCSKTCGGGVKTRKVKCIRELAFGQVVDQPAQKCTKNKPKTLKVCNSRKCHYHDEINKIWESNSIDALAKLSFDAPKPFGPKSFEKTFDAPKIFDGAFDGKHFDSKTFDGKSYDNNKVMNTDGNYIQNELHKRIVLKVNGKAVLLKGTLVKLRCPKNKSHHKKMNKTEWFKDDAPIKYGKKYQAIGRGALRIKNMNLPDQGLYSCSWNYGLHKFNIKIQVKTIQDSEEDKTVERPNYSTKFNFKINNEDDKKGNEDFGKINFAENPNSDKELAKKKINDLKKLKNQLFAESPNTIVPLDSWEVNHGSNGHGTIGSVADEKSKIQFTGYNSEEVKRDKIDGKVNDKISIPEFQQLLSKIENRFNRKSLSSESLINSSNNEMNITSSEESRPESIVLGKGNPKLLKFHWITSEWSSCNSLCGKGIQVRAIQCFVSFENVSNSVDDSLCVDAGLITPHTTKECGFLDCPFWETGQWSECEDCIDINLAIQRRTVNCVLPNGTLSNANHCNSTDKPIDNRQCFNEDCKTNWFPGPWSKCQGKCGEEGSQSRILQCLWIESHKPAGALCDDKPKPEVIQTCLTAKCSGECNDVSHHCNLVKSLNACHLPHYKKQCCVTCS